MEKTIRERRLRWFGHLLRLDPDTPAKKALKEYLRKVDKPKGKQKTTWYDIVYKDIKVTSGLNIDFQDRIIATNELMKICEGRKEWNNIIKRMMLHHE